MAHIDQFNERYGRGTVDFATAQPRPGQPVGVWTTQSALRSPAYTTNWDELWAIRAWAVPQSRLFAATAGRWLLATSGTPRFYVLRKSRRTTLAHLE